MQEIPLQKFSGLPLIGLGTWRLQGDECVKIVKNAIDLGYRHIDTADLYNNHRDIAKAIQGISRSELFIVSKIYLNDLAPEKIKSAIPRFLDELQTDYLDFLLIHWPHPTLASEISLEAMNQFKQAGLIRGLGVSNFVRQHLRSLKPYHFPILINQIEMHPYLQRRELVEFCRNENIAITAYRPLAKGAFENNETLMTIGKKYHKSPSQIALRWLVQQDISAIPKASSVEHLKKNISVFDFSLKENEMEIIRKMDAGIRYCADVTGSMPED